MYIRKHLPLVLALLSVASLWGCEMSRGLEHAHYVRLPDPETAIIGEDNTVICGTDEDLGKMRLNTETMRYEICR